MIEWTKEMMNTTWYQWLETVGVWVIEWVFFVLLIQMTVTVFIKGLFAIHRVENVSLEYFSNIAVFSMLWALFIKIYIF